MAIKVHAKERIYFGLMVALGMFCYGTIFACGYKEAFDIFQFLPLFAYIVLFFMLSKLYLIGHIRGSAVKILPEQFPDIYAVLKRQSELLGFSKIPNMYLMQSGGTLN